MSAASRRRRRPPARARLKDSRRTGLPSGSVLQSYRPRRRRRRPKLWLLPVALVLLGLAYWAWPHGAQSERPASRPQAKPAMATSPAGVTRNTAAAAASAKKAIKVASFLGGQSRRLEGFGPSPRALNLQWKLLVGSGQTRRKGDDAITTWAGTGWTGQPTVLAENGRTWLFLGGYDHNLHKIDAHSGKVQWEAEWPDVMKGTNTLVPNPRPKGDASRVIVVSGSRRGSEYDVSDRRIAPLRAVSAVTGREMWRLPVPKTDNYSRDVDSSPLWYKNVLYAPVEPGYVYALDPFRTVVKGGVRQPVVLARSRRLYDESDVASHPDEGGANLAIESSPAAIGDVIYVTSGAGHVYGLNRRTLKVVWDFKTGCDIDGTPVVTDDGKLLVTLEQQYTTRQGGIYLLDPSKPPKDAVVWFYPSPDRGFGEWAGGSVGSASMTSGGKKGDKPRLVAIRTVDGSLRLLSLDALTDERETGPGAEKPAPAPVEVFLKHIGASISTPLLVGDSLVTAGYDNKVRLYRLSYAEAEKGEDGAVPSRDGRWWKVSVKEQDSFKGGAAFESTPLVYKGRVYIGCRDGYLYCLGE